MTFIATVLERVLAGVTWLALRIATVCEHGSVRRIWRRWLEAIGAEPQAPPVVYRRRA